MLNITYNSLISVNDKLVLSVKLSYLTARRSMFYLKSIDFRLEYVHCLMHYLATVFYAMLSLLHRVLVVQTIEATFEHIALIVVIRSISIG